MFELPSDRTSVTSRHATFPTKVDEENGVTRWRNKRRDQREERERELVLFALRLFSSSLFRERLIALKRTCPKLNSIPADPSQLEFRFTRTPPAAPPNMFGTSVSHSVKRIFPSTFAAGSFFRYLLYIALRLTRSPCTKQREQNSK